ncbi:coiled-coil domain-containing protein 183 isoform X2 [Mauremys reevesii]|uniref:coiled-coil domain-containing protein 183 isoform X2 n=1 Tax=Mauremys reevesii TaxID=260615 RepID=UPI00193F068C|nr:coiled-coil domain-containing protein 183 isoform X2 [Mauremys reevesii]
MKFQRKKDIKQQIRELRAIISLQEQGKKLFAHSTEEKLTQNKGLISFLRGNVHDEMCTLGVAQKYDQVTISQACWDQKHLKMHLARSTVEAAREKLQNFIFNRMNVYNVLLYEVKRRGGMLEGLQRKLQHLADMEGADRQGQIQLQVIRQLENNIEKMLMKIRTGEKIYYLYLKMVDFLKDELAQLPLQLNVLQHMVEVYQVELKGMRLMAVDATEATEAAKTDMTNMETEFIAERRFRENSLNFQKKQIDRIRVKEASERHRRVQARRDLNVDFPVLISRAKLEASKAQIEYQAQVTSEVDKIKCAVQCSHLWDIAGRFLAQQKTGENLQQQIVECEQKREELEAKLKELELERAELKFHQTPSSISSRKLAEELKKNLEAEEVRLHQVHTQMLKNQELLLSFENGIDNLLIRLYGITVPGHGDIHVDTSDTYDKLQFCETKLLHLTKVMTHLPSYNFSREENNETYVKVRNFLEESTRNERQNLKISFEDEEDAVRDTFDFADIDHSYVPNRDEIKKQGVRLIETMTKAAKKKQRGGRKGT